VDDFFAFTRLIESTFEIQDRPVARGGERDERPPMERCNAINPFSMWQDAPMAQQNPAAPSHEYGLDDMVNASELREFVFCERAWWLNRQGYAVSQQMQAKRSDGVAFHEARARAARKASSSQALWWALILGLAAAAIWMARMLMESRH
jgi:hypothetical protein